MDRHRTDEANGFKSTFVEDEIGELRKYIVEMMHAEMKLMESIKLNESNIAAANTRIKHFKELIVQERARFKTLKKELEKDVNELKLIEDKQSGVEEKHQQFKDAVTQRQNEVQALRAQFQHQRATMLSLRCQILDVTTSLERLSLQDKSVEKETCNVTVALNGCVEPTAERASRQKLRAKIRYTQQFIAQMDEETSQLIETRTKVEAEIQAFEQEAHKLRESIFFKEKEAEVLFNRLHEDTLRITKENGKIENKLKAKRRKFRVKTKNEISSLRRRISFITSELERGQMINEDSLSNIEALGSTRKELEQMLSARNEQLAATESAITDQTTAIATFERSAGAFDTTRLQEELAAKRANAQAAQTKLEQKQTMLKLVEVDQTQLEATLEGIGAQILAAKSAVGRLDGEILSITTDIQNQESKNRQLLEAKVDAKKKCDDLQAEYQEQQRNNKNTIQLQSKLRRQKATLLKQEQALSVELQEAERLSRILGEGIKHGMEYAEQLREANAFGNEKEKRIEFELRRQELNLQQQCAHEESNFRADIAVWDEKIKLVEKQLRSI
ncbi:hypothetical protein DVH05_006416 [Phytophthora capsici]|nr:hypothetical protein DVH05_006416 [Phytophthora capsici]